MIDLHDIPTRHGTGAYAYSGDVNLCYGGIFIDTSDIRHGYASAVRVTDLDSACGFTGAVMVEHIVILYDRDRIREAIGACGWDVKGPAAICEALAGYGHYDPDDGWDGYLSHHTEIVQCDPDGPREFDGWRADLILDSDDDLEEHVASVHL